MDILRDEIDQAFVLAGVDVSLVVLFPKHIRFLPYTAGCQTA
jgi:hypothetical protein